MTLQDREQIQERFTQNATLASNITRCCENMERWSDAYRPSFSPHFGSLKWAWQSHNLRKSCGDRRVLSCCVSPERILQHATPVPAPSGVTRFSSVPPEIWRAPPGPQIDTGHWREKRLTTYSRYYVRMCDPSLCW